MRIQQTNQKRPLDLLAVGAGGHIAAACSVFGVRGDVDVWQIGSGENRFTYLASNLGVVSLAFTAEGRHIMVGVIGAGVRIAELGGSLVPELETQLPQPSLALSQDGTQLLLASSFGPNGGVELWSITDWEFTRLWAGTSDAARWPRAPAFSPDGMFVAMGQTSSMIWTANQIHIRDAENGKVLLRIPGNPAEPVLQLAFSADGSKLLSRISGRIIQVFDTTAGALVGELVHPGRPYVTGMAVHPNGTVACSRTNGTVCLWNIERPELVRTLDWKLGKLVSVAFSPDGSIGAAGTEDGQVVVWDVDE